MMHATCRRYEEVLRQNNAVDLDDLLGLTVALLQHDRPLLDRLKSDHVRWVPIDPCLWRPAASWQACCAQSQTYAFCRHMLVDEFQDTNTPQYELVRLLTLPQVTSSHAALPCLCNLCIMLCRRLAVASSACTLSSEPAGQSVCGGRPRPVHLRVARR